MSKKVLKTRRRKLKRAGALSVVLGSHHRPLNDTRYTVSQVETYSNGSPKIIYHGEAKARVPIQSPICREDARCAPPQVTYEMDGHGILIEYEPDGTYTRYEGEFLNNMKHGNGKIQMSNGTTYEGEWDNNAMSGQGKIVFTNSFYRDYKGEFINGQMHGDGVMHMTNGDKYEGQWNNGEMHGTGVLTFANGDKYEGEFINGQMQESGHLYDADGNEIEYVDEDNDTEGEN
jgi:hypothetical protein